ncbi:DUF3999 family protein [Cocleimonas flava]|uniref:Uncharacterized protein DUF3999 n=1 Tax=Cocleimonas flava TaxID=634765 RepID=A0A4R1ES65_9GAMM|nr:DUF3999 family protein [Cocleimonas flava]TCJ82742.1 uncharacterized protein DUF3999 [Cocleimonas flava]
MRMKAKHQLLKVFGVCAITAALQFSLNAAPFTLEDFAHSAELTNATTSLREVDLPLIVYEKMQRKDYGDIRVFSADGQLVPYQLSRIERVNSQQQKPLVFYPFTKEQAEDTGNIKVIIEQNKNTNQQNGQQSIKIVQKWGGDPDNHQDDKEYQYIIENPENTSAGHKLNMCGLKLDWVQEKPSMVLPLKLESSNNLQNWSTVSRKQTVSKLNYSGSKLIQDEIGFSCTSQKYLRLTWLNPNSQVHIQKIQGIYNSTGKQQTQWKSLGKPGYDKDGNWLFESDVVAAITQMEFVAPQDGLLYKGKLYSRNHDNDEWRFSHNISQYRLNIGDTQLQSSAFSINPNKNRYWKVTLDSEGQFTDEQLPEIRAAWSPRKLLFLAQGKEPFKIAFGNPNIKPSQQNDLNNLITTIRDSGSMVDNVKLSEIENSGKVFSPDTNWKLILFWVMLILGTLLMAYMAFKLYKQMGEDKAGD